MLLAEEGLEVQFKAILKATQLETWKGVHLLVFHTTRLDKDQNVTYLQSMFAGTVPWGKRSAHDPHHTAHSHNLPPSPLDHVIQNMFCQRDRA